TRALALTPALIGVLSFGPDAVGDLLVLTQVVLSFQLPFALYPLIRMTSDRGLMGRHATNPAIAALAWLLFAIITSADLWLLQHLISMP
ncbi:MAG TPA: divalent metal cation transporter, partial [Sphingomicrobium sp.]|nr:divalent metal cation transporter [Sphingomicrobium sp.]